MTGSNKINVPEIIHFAGIALLLLAVFIGVLYWQNGDFMLTIPLTIIIIGALYGLVFLLIKLKTATKNPEEMRKWEIITAVLGYGGVAIVSLFFFSHFMDYQFNRRADVKESGMEKIEAIEKMFAAYEKHVNDTANEYGREVRNNYNKRNSDKSKAAFYSAHSIDPKTLFTGDLDKDINNLKAGFKSKLKDGYRTLKSESQVFVNKGKSALSGINPIGIPSVYNSADDKFETWSGELVRISKGLTYGEANAFNPNGLPENSEINLSSINKQRFFNPLTLLLFLLLHGMILWPYLFSERSGISRGDGRGGARTGGEI